MNPQSYNWSVIITVMVFDLVGSYFISSGFICFRFYFSLYNVNYDVFIFSISL